VLGPMSPNSPAGRSAHKTRRQGQVALGDYERFKGQASTCSVVKGTVSPAPDSLIRPRNSHAGGFSVLTRDTAGR
jgi:hypothetical protein